MILPLRTETMQERRAAHEVIEQVGAALSRIGVASVRFSDTAAAVSPHVIAAAQY